MTKPSLTAKEIGQLNFERFGKSVSPITIRAWMRDQGIKAARGTDQRATNLYTREQAEAFLSREQGRGAAAKSHPHHKSDAFQKTVRSKAYGGKRIRKKET